MFGCTEGWFGKRFSHALTGFLNGERERANRAAHDALDANVIAAEHEQWRVQHERDERAGKPNDRLADAWGHPHAHAGDAGGSTMAPVPLGRVWRIPSTSETVDLGQFDPERAPIVTIASGDVVIYENTWTHFLNRLQPGVSINELGTMRKAGHGRGVHSIIGPVAVEHAEPGDLLEIRFLALRTIDFGANFHNAAEMRTGSLPDDFEHGHVHYFDLNAADGYVDFNEHIKLELQAVSGHVRRGAQERQDGQFGRAGSARGQHRREGTHGRLDALRAGVAQGRLALHR